MKKATRGKFGINGDALKKSLKQLVSPIFLLILLGSCLLWYATKLNHEYTTDMPLNVRIDGQKYRLTATVTGRGSVIVAQKLSLKRRLELTLDELSVRRSRETEGALVITPASLQRSINSKIKDLKIDHVVDAPEFIPAPKPEPEPEKDAKKETKSKDKKSK
jgi:hypothetical protein